MSETTQSILYGTSALSVAAVVAVVLAVVRSPRSHDEVARRRAAQMLLVGTSMHCAHFCEEFATGFHERFPELLGLAPWPAEFFVIFNVTWIAIWALSAVGMQVGFRPAYFPAWFLGIGMTVNGVAHPALALAVGGYFPGLVSSPAVGAVGVLLTQRLFRLTSPT